MKCYLAQSVLAYPATTPTDTASVAPRNQIWMEQGVQNMLNLVTAIGKPLHSVMSQLFFRPGTRKAARHWSTHPVQESGWREVALHYDVRDLTIEELGELASELYTRNLINLEDVVSFIPFEESWDMSLVSNLRDGIKRDWLTEYRLRVDFGDSSYPETMRRLLGYLERLEHHRRRLRRTAPNLLGEALATA